MLHTLTLVDSPLLTLFTAPFPPPRTPLFPRRWPVLSIDFTSSERRLLREMIDGMLSELRMEIADTDRLEYREMLRARKAVLQRMLDAIEPVADPEVPA
jgi:hypothetical protein